MLRARLDLWHRRWKVMKIPLLPKQRCQRSSRSHPMTARSGTRPRYLGPLANKLNVRLHFAYFAVITLVVFMATTNYADTLSATTRPFAKSGYAKRTRQTAVLALPYRSTTAKRVAAERHMVRITMQLLTFDVRISSLARTSAEAAVKSAKDEVAWEVERIHLWMC